jgi:hypothetical protein
MKKPDSHDLALVLEQMALINARMDARTAHALAAVAVAIGATLVAHRRHDAHSEPSPHELHVEQLPPPPPFPLTLLLS